MPPLNSDQDLILASSPFSMVWEEQGEHASFWTCLSPCSSQLSWSPEGGVSVNHTGLTLFISKMSPRLGGRRSGS